MRWKLVYRLISCYSLKKVQTAFFSAYDNTTEDIKQRFEQTHCMIYYSIQNVLASSIKGRKTEDQVNQILPFCQGDLVKQKTKSPLKVSGGMNNARATTIDSVILFFYGIYLNG